MNLEIGNWRDPEIQPQYKPVYPKDIPAWARGMDCKYFLWKINKSTYMCTQNEYLENKSILTNFENESPLYADLVASCLSYTDQGSIRRYLDIFKKLQICPKVVSTLYYSSLSSIK